MTLKVCEIGRGREEEGPSKPSYQKINNERNYWGKVISIQYLFYLIYNRFYSYNILTILRNLENKFKRNHYIFIIQYIFWKHWLGKPQKKKSSSTNGQAVKRGGGVKAGPLRKKELFF